LKTLIYLHGFNSSAQSIKALNTRQYFQEHSVDFNLSIPNLPSSPLEVVDAVTCLIREIGASQVAGFIGSSLGGYLSLYFQQSTVFESIPKIVLINPAVRPYELLVDYIGENQNPYTGERYTVESHHMNELKSLSVPSIATPDNTLLLTQTGDEVLGFQQAVSALPKAKAWVTAGGDHAYSGYLSALPAIANFFQ